MIVSVLRIVAGATLLLADALLLADVLPLCVATEAEGVDGPVGIVPGIMIAGTVPCNSVDE